MKRRVLYLLNIYLATMVVFLLAKIVFMLFNGKGHHLTASDALSAIVHGLTLDLSTSFYIVAVPFLVMMASVWVCVPRWVLRSYYALMALAMSMVFISDTVVYSFWGTKLDASYVQYLEQPEGITQSVSALYLLAVGIVLCLSTAVIFISLNLTPQPKAERGSMKQRIGETLFYLVCIPLIVIGIRGGIGDSTTNIGQVYYSENQFLNHSAVNPVFNFFDSFTNQIDETDAYTFFSTERCEELTSQIYTTESKNSDTLLTTTRPNIVVILLESAGEQFADAMPRLQQLKREGISFERCYANSWRTDRGTVCALSGYPSFPNLSVMKIPEKSSTLPGIARTLLAEGYTTSYLYGGDINFTNMRSYLYSTRWQKIVSMKDYSRSEQQTARWGVRDDITFQTLYDQIVSAPADGRHLWGYSTLSSHEPWDVPTHRCDDEVANAFDYLDDCLYNFIEKLRHSPVWDNLLIVLTADHGINHGTIDPSTPLLKNHIPMLWLGGAVKEPRTVDRICNQSDIAATLLGQLRLNHDDFTFSRDVLSETYVHPTAVHNYNTVQWIVDSTGHVLYDFVNEMAIIKESTDADRLIDIDKAIIQRTYNDFNNLNHIK